MAKNRNKWTNQTKWTKMDKRKTASNPQRIRVFRKVCPFFVHLSRISTQRYKIILIFVLTSFFQKLDKWTKLPLYTPQTLGINAFLVKISFVQPVDKITFVHPSNPWYYWLSCKNLVFWTIPVYQRKSGILSRLSTGLWKSRKSVDKSEKWKIG